MNNELPIPYLARYGETSWSPTGQSYQFQSPTEESEQVARRWVNGLLRNDAHQVAALGSKQSSEKRQQAKARSIR